MPKKPLCIDRKGFRHHGNVQEEFLHNLKRGELELGQVINYSEISGIDEYDFLVTGITDDVIYLEAVPVSPSVEKDQDKLKSREIIKDYLEEYHEKEE